MSQVYVLGSTGGAQLFGRLTAYGDGGVVVNGNQASTGTTLFSGAQLQTGDKTGASVALASTGTLEIAPNTNLSLTFDRGQINVRVASGDATLWTSAGVKGSLTMPDGKVATTDGVTAASIGGTTSLGGAADPQINRTNNPCKIGGIPCALFWVMIGGGGAVATYFALRNNNNPSPSQP
jgi:hypothetical protein